METQDLTAQRELSFKVNEQGWPVSIIEQVENSKTNEAYCEALWFGLQSQSGRKTLLVKEILDKNHIVTGCSYYKHGLDKKQKLFDYFFSNGEIKLADN